MTARLRAVLRRSHLAAVSTQLELGDLCFSPVRGVVSIDEQELTSPFRKPPAGSLLRQPEEPLDKQELAQIALGRKLTLYDRSLDMHVSNLRKKDRPAPDGRPRIRRCAVAVTTTASNPPLLYLSLLCEKRQR